MANFDLPLHGNWIIDLPIFELLIAFNFDLYTHHLLIAKIVGKMASSHPIIFSLNIDLEAEIFVVHPNNGSGSMKSLRRSIHFRPALPIGS
jgi:hypothetical protein